MAIKKTRFVVIVTAICLTSSVGFLVILRILEIRTLAEVVLAACLHNGTDKVVSLVHGIFKPGD